MNFTEGILQSIGFKEFEEYLQLPIEERNTEEGDKHFADGVSKLKIVTRQYAKKQLKWINQRFLRPSRRQIPPVYWLDGSSRDPTDWDTNVTSVAMKIIDACMSNKRDHPILTDRLVPAAEKPFEDDLTSRKCEICDNKILLGSAQWDVHLKSYKHHKALKRIKKLAQGRLLNSTDGEGINFHTVDHTANNITKVEGAQVQSQ